MTGDGRDKSLEGLEEVLGHVYSGGVSTGGLRESRVTEETTKATENLWT